MALVCSMCGEKAAIAIFTIMDTGDTMSPCEDHFIDFVAGLAESVLGTDPSQFNVDDGVDVQSAPDDDGEAIPTEVLETIAEEYDMGNDPGPTSDEQSGQTGDESETSPSNDQSETTVASDS